MTYTGQEFHDRSEAGDQNALQEALFAAKSITFDDGYRPNLTGSVVDPKHREQALIGKANNATYIKMEFDDNSYLEITRLLEDHIIVFWGVLGVDDLGPTMRVIKRPLPPGVN
jgi:hypothetical protein